jgi:hypothetical protein
MILAKPRCDARGCNDAPIVFECGCRRCQSEPEIEEHFYSCAGHVDDVNEKHMRIRGRPAQWVSRTPV